MKFTNSLIVTLAGLLSLTYLGYRGIDTSSSIAGLVSAYVLGRVGLKGTGMMAASRDSTCDTQKAIETLKD
jgi:hypothetical protein